MEALQKQADKKASLWPVLKHGPRSLTCVRVSRVIQTLFIDNAKWKWKSTLIVDQGGKSNPLYRGKDGTIGRQDIPRRARADMLGPERWWTMPEQGQARGNSGGGSQRYWRANRSSDLGIGAKDSSNHLVAGSLRSFPQDSWSSIHIYVVSSRKAND
jgi:hypothetical protein